MEQEVYNPNTCKCSVSLVLCFICAIIFYKNSFLAYRVQTSIFLLTYIFVSVATGIQGLAASVFDTITWAAFLSLLLQFHIINIYD